MAYCRICQNEEIHVARVLGICRSCLLENFSKYQEHLANVHATSRRRFGLPPSIPKDPQGVICSLCANNCQITEGKKGYCGLKENRKNRLVIKDGNLNYYLDPLPTNCVGSFICPANGGNPEFSYTQCPEYDYYNLAVFYYGCSFNCLSCQNIQHKERLTTYRPTSPEELAAKITKKTSCLCFFGGDPTVQLKHSLKTAKEALRLTKGRIFRICWETNGSMNRAYLDQMAEIALQSGGYIKFDLKAYHKEIALALCGVSNKQTLENFRYLASLITKRKGLPFLIANTLLVPTYVNQEEVRKLADFIASLDKNICYSLLAFAPQYLLSDLPYTSKKEAIASLRTSVGAGLKNVRLGNTHLLRE